MIGAVHHNPVTAKSSNTKNKSKVNNKNSFVNNSSSHDQESVNNPIVMTTNPYQNQLVQKPAWFQANKKHHNHN